MSKQRRNLRTRRAYAGCATTAGPLVAPRRPDQPVRFRRVGTGRERWGLTGLVPLNAATASLFIGWLLLPAHIPGAAGRLPGPLLAAASGGRTASGRSCCAPGCRRCGAT